MKKSAILIISTFIILFLFISSLHAAVPRGLNIKVRDSHGHDIVLYKDSYALVIGASQYFKGWPKLPGVRQDVQEVHSLLESQGFNIVLVEDPDRAGLLQAFDNFINSYGLEPENRLIIYFAGHGHTIRQTYGDEMGYIIPIDAPNPNADLNGFLAKAIDMQQIEVYAKRIQAKHTLFVFDSCFSGTIFALSRAVPEHISYKTAKPVRQFITSGSAEEQVPDKSIFKQQFVSALNGEADFNRDGYVTGTELGEYLQDRVVNYSSGAQHPQYGKIRNPNLDKGDFVFLSNTPRPEPILSPEPEISQAPVKTEPDKLQQLREEKNRLEAERRQLELELEKQRLETERAKLAKLQEEKKRAEEEQKRQSERKIEGIYDCNGTNPNGTTYRGTVTISRNNDQYFLVWNIASSTFKGSGTYQGNLLVINWGAPYPVIYQLNQDGRLIGTWNNGTGTETLIPKF